MDYKKLYEQLMNEDSDYENEDTHFAYNYCLISNEKVPIADGLKLPCNHFFRYDCLYNEMLYTILSKKLKGKAIQCPYCRTIHKGILPYREGYKEIIGLNYPESKAIKLNKCMFMFKKGRRNGKICNAGCNGKYCKKCEKRVQNQKKYLEQKLNKNNENKKGNSIPIIKNEINQCCNTVIRYGPRKGLVCGRKLNNNNTLCGIHNKK